MSKVWLITSGSYSDYSIDFVFATQALADEFIATCESAGWHDFDIEERDLLDELPTRAVRYDVHVVDDDEPTVRSTVMWDDAVQFAEQGHAWCYQGRWVATGCARHQDVAVKVAQDALAEARARAAGI